MNYLNESFVFSKDDLYINFDKFESGKSNICLITGLSGSGKSTLGKILAKKYKAEYVELDKFFIFDKKEDLEGLSKTFDKYFENNKGIYDLILKMEKRDDPVIPLLLLMNLINYCKLFKNRKFILEGVQLYLFGTKKLKEYPIIFKNTSLIKSMSRMFKRDFIEYDGLKYRECIKYIPKFLRIYIEDEKDLNKFKKAILKKEGYVMYNPNEIDVLLEAQQILHENVLASLLEWFKRKLQSIGEMFSAFKRKISGHNLSPEQRQAVAMAEKECRGIKGICNKGIASCKRGASAAAYAYKQSLPSHAKSMADYMARVKFHDAVNKKVGEIAGKGISKAVQAGEKSNNKYAKAASGVVKKGMNKGYELNRKYGKDIEAYQRVRKVQGGIDTWKRTGKLI